MNEMHTGDTTLLVSFAHSNYLTCSSHGAIQMLTLLLTKLKIILSLLSDLGINGQGES